MLQEAWLGSRCGRNRDEPKGAGSGTVISKAREGVGIESAHRIFMCI